MSPISRSARREPLPIALIGCGRAAERLWVPAIAATAGARLVAAVDPIPDRRGLAARGFAGCRTFASAEELLGEDGSAPDGTTPDGVAGVAPDGSDPDATGGKTPAAWIVTTPPRAHAAVAALALRAGIPVLVEKPLALELEEGERLRALAEGAGVPLVMGFNRRHLEPVLRLRERLAAHDGRGPIAIDSVITSDATGWDRVERAAGEEEPDPLDDLATHHIDLARALVGGWIESVSAIRPTPGVVEVELRFAGSHRARCRAARTATSEERIAVSADGRRYTITSASRRLTPAGGPVRSALDAADAVSRRLTRRPAPMAASFRRQLGHFVRTARAADPEGPAESGVVQGVAVLRAVEAARRSARAGGRAIDPAEL